MDYDDGFVAYLNGTADRPLKRNRYTTSFNAGRWQSRSFKGDSSPQPVSHFDVDPSLLVAGTNVLAIQGHNVTSGSSDFSLIPELAEVKETASFQQGADGYTSAVDTTLMQSEGSTIHGALPEILWDADDPSGTGQSNFALIRFDDIFDFDGGPIPVGATIQSATLSYVVFNVGNPADVNEVIVDWATGETYNSFGGDAGVQTDEYGVSLGSATGPSMGVQSIDVTESLARWATNPSSNRGWIFRPTGTDGVDIRSSEYGTLAERPMLTVEYTTGGTPPACNPLTVSHTGQGSDPVATIANSVGCPAGEYLAGESIPLVGAVPNSSWQIASWTGTVNNSSTADTNTVTMPAAAHLAGVTYEEGVAPPPPAVLENFDSYEAGDDPANWFDSEENNGLNEDDSLFKVFDLSGEKVFGTTSTATNIHTHFTGAGSERLQRLYVQRPDDDNRHSRRHRCYIFERLSEFGCLLSPA